MLAVNQTTGGLTKVAEPFIPSPATPCRFSFNGTTGALNEVAGSPFATDEFPRPAAFRPSGGQLAVVNYVGAIRPGRSRRFANLGGPAVARLEGCDPWPEAPPPLVIAT